MGGSSVQIGKAVIALLVVAVLVARVLLRGRVRDLEKLVSGALVALAVVSVGNYYGFSARPIVRATQVSGYDLLHYYLNSKYFDELGYIHLYEAMVAADEELSRNFRRWRVRKVRDLDSSVSIPYADVLPKAERTKRRFTTRRWRQFVHDFRFLQDATPQSHQSQIFYDHGYNGPPLLQTLAGPITNVVPVEKVKWLCHVETLLLLGLFGAMLRLRGTRVTAIAVTVFFVSISASWPGVGFAIFRIDWFVALVLACLLLGDADDQAGRGRPWRAFGAGVLIAYATMMRLFPVLWLFGLGVRALWELVGARRIDRVAVAVGGGFLAGSVVMGSLAYASVGQRNVAEFVEDIVEHVQPMNLSSQRMGFGIALAYRGELRDWGGPGKQQAKYRLVGELAPLRYAVAILALVVLGFTIRPLGASRPPARATAGEATELGFVPFYFLMIASQYYWIHRTMMVLHHAPRAERERDHLVALSALLVIEAIANVIDAWTRFRYATTATASVALGLYCAWVVGARLRRVLRDVPRPSERAAKEA